MSREHWGGSWSSLSGIAAAAAATTAGAQQSAIEATAFRGILTPSQKTREKKLIKCSGIGNWGNQELQKITHRSQ